MWKSRNLAGCIATKMRTWNNPQAVVVIQGAIDLVEMVVVVEAPPPALAIEALDIVSPISVPVRCVAVVARLGQDSEDTAVPKAMLLREKICDSRAERGQLAVLDQRSLVQLVSINRLQPLCLWVALSSQRT